MAKKRIAIDLANVHAPDNGKPLTTLAWGDEVEVVAEDDKGITVHLQRLADTGASFTLTPVEGRIKRPSKESGLRVSDITQPAAGPGKVLRLDFVDVQQGDGAVLETPGGAVMLIDGGDNQLFSRYLAARFQGSSAAQPRDIDCILVTHGDADHFQGLTEIHDSEKHPDRWKRLFIRPLRVYHNGLVKRPGEKDGKDRPEKEMLGDTVQGPDKRPVITDLVDDLRQVPDAQMNRPFIGWKRALEAWTQRGELSMRRIAAGAPGLADRFKFLTDEGIGVEVLGPRPTVVNGQEGLAFLGNPRRNPAPDPGEAPVTFTGLSASHTINGHSVVLRLTFGDVRILLAGDLNAEAEEALTRRHLQGQLDLESEVFKVPHHGSADFSVPFLKAVSPVVSVVSSGDESEQKEFIHPRASLLGALSKNARPTVSEPPVFVTELAAFFQVEGWVRPHADPPLHHRTQLSKRRDEFFAFTRKSFGLVKVRTDGKRLLVYTYSGREDLQEAYAFDCTGGEVKPVNVRKA